MNTNSADPMFVHERSMANREHRLSGLTPKTVAQPADSHASEPGVSNNHLKKF